jgi:hypothetical protein
VLVPTVYVGQASSHGVRPKAPGGDTLVGRAELVGREETHELRRRMGWRESKMKMKMEMFCLANDIFPGRLVRTSLVEFSF